MVKESAILPLLARALPLAVPRLVAASVAALRERALAARFDRPAVWLHGDLHPGNPLMRDERLGR